MGEIEKQTLIKSSGRLEEVTSKLRVSIPQVWGIECVKALIGTRRTAQDGVTEVIEARLGCCIMKFSFDIILTESYVGIYT